MFYEVSNFLVGKSLFIYLQIAFFGLPFWHNYKSSFNTICGEERRKHATAILTFLQPSRHTWVSVAAAVVVVCIY